MTNCLLHYYRLKGGWGIFMRFFRFMNDKLGILEPLESFLGVELLEKS